MSKELASAMYKNNSQPTTTPTQRKNNEAERKASKVLGNNGLIGKILDHADSPTTVVCGVAVSKRWLHHASDRVFLCRFGARHPPHLLASTSPATVSCTRSSS
jgi:hypothetical protein